MPGVMKMSRHLKMEWGHAVLGQAGVADACPLPLRPAEPRRGLSRAKIKLNDR